MHWKQESTPTAAPSLRSDTKCRKATPLYIDFPTLTGVNKRVVPSAWWADSHADMLERFLYADLVIGLGRHSWAGIRIGHVTVRDFNVAARVGRVVLASRAHGRRQLGRQLEYWPCARGGAGYGEPKDGVCGASVWLATRGFRSWPRRPGRATSQSLRAQTRAASSVSTSGRKTSRRSHELPSRRNSQRPRSRSDQPSVPPPLRPRRPTGLPRDRDSMNCSVQTTVCEAIQAIHGPFLLYALSRVNDGSGALDRVTAVVLRHPGIFQ